MEEIRYEKKSKIFLWINIFDSVFHHHPDNIHQLTAQAYESLSFCFALGDFPPEVCTSRVIARP